MTIALSGCTVLGEYRWGKQTLQVVHLPDDEHPRRHGGYLYGVRWNHTTEIRCSTEVSAWTLFDQLASWGHGFEWMFTHV